jgi:hypothetical protein
MQASTARKVRLQAFCSHCQLVSDLAFLESDDDIKDMAASYCYVFMCTFIKKM